jgi:hypothetical protein
MSYRGIDRAIAALGQINTGHMDAGDAISSCFVSQKDGVMMVRHVLMGLKKQPKMDNLWPLTGFACGGHRFNQPVLWCHGLCGAYTCGECD